MINDIEHFFMSLLAIRASSLEKYSDYLPIFLIDFFFAIELYEFFIYFGY